MSYIDHIYEVIVRESDGLDALYENYIVHLVGYSGLNDLKQYKLIETCGVVNGMQLYTICDKN